MRARIAAVFALGFATGVLCLGVGLWRSGAIQAPAPLQAVVPAWKRPMVPLPLDLNQLTAEAKKMPPSAVEPPPPLPEPPSSSTPSAAPPSSAPPAPHAGEA